MSHRTTLRHIALGTLSGVGLAGGLLTASPAFAGKPECAYTKPVLAKVVGKNSGYDDLVQPTEVRSVMMTDEKGDPLRKLVKDLRVQYNDHVINGCPVHLRNYDDKLVGPTLRVKPGDRIDLMLKNLLPAAENRSHPEGAPWYHHNGPVDFNVTNFHFHGGWVAPGGTGDNVLRRMEPRPANDGHPIRINVPADHPPGTYWYHAHIHGSTAVQVSSGMAGALIVEGGLDDVPAIKAAKEQVMVVQHIVYDDNGLIEDFSNFGGGTWQKTNRMATINGQLVPTITMRPGEVQRWRVIGAAIHETTFLQLEGHALHEIALDGLSTGKVTTWPKEKYVELYPGYRVDVMVQASTTPGTYMLYDAAATPPRQLREYGPEDREALAKIVVEGAPLPMTLPTTSDVAATKAHPEVFTDADVMATGGSTQKVDFQVGFFFCDTKPDRPCVPCPPKADSTDLPGYKATIKAHLTKFAKPSAAPSTWVPTDSNVDDFVVRTRADVQCNKSLKKAVAASSPAFADPEPAQLKFMVNGKPFAGGETKFSDKVEKVGKWEVTSTSNAGHPFHIHVNPFQMTRKDPEGNDEIVWKDTVFVGPRQPPMALYTKYRRFKGMFVMHCHILDHEDEGMMTLMEITD